ncbi:WGR domain-containing protein, partial [Lentzea indica]|uniref:WGR domain-containing protein n=1 Tax=Lentzea indica TaxID=2604800 RepID=UPI00143CA709
MRRWELVSGGSAKFWEIGRDGAAVTVRFGRLDTHGQTQTKELASAEAAEAHVAKLVAEKEKKGYRPIGSAQVVQELPDAAPVAEQSTASVAEQPAVVDEDTWVMPKAWLRDAVRQRGFDPAPVFSVDAELAETARRRVAKQTATTIERVLSEPASDQDLVRAARQHLAGRPDPV